MQISWRFSVISRQDFRHSEGNGVFSGVFNHFYAKKYALGVTLVVTLVVTLAVTLVVTLGVTLAVSLVVTLAVTPAVTLRITKKAAREGSPVYYKSSIPIRKKTSKMPQIRRIRTHIRRVRVRFFSTSRSVVP